MPVATPTIEKEKQKETQKAEPPKRCHVMILNDDYTHMDFVIMVLMEIFGHTMENAFMITMDVHVKGKGLAGTYPREIAEQKAEEVMTAARAEEFPLRAEVVDE